MNPHDMFCPYRDCPSHAQPGSDHIVCHSRKERRYRCRRCRRTFVERKGTPYYRLHTPEATLTCVMTLLAHGCPPQALVAAFGLEERTVAGFHYIFSKRAFEWLRAGRKSPVWRRKLVLTSIGRFDRECMVEPSGEACRPRQALLEY